MFSELADGEVILIRTDHDRGDGIRGVCEICDLFVENGAVEDD